VDIVSSEFFHQDNGLMRKTIIKPKLLNLRSFFKMQ